MLARSSLLFLALGVVAVAAEIIPPPPMTVPERPPSDRYAKLRTSLPFSVATAAEKPPEEKVSWAQNLYLGSVARPAVGGTEKEWVIIKDRTQPGVLIELFGTDPNAEGYQLVKLEWSEDPRKTKAQVKKGGEFATIEPDQMAFQSSAPPASVQPPRGAQPGAIPAPAQQNALRPPPATTAARPPTIPRPTNTAPIIQPQARPPQLPGAVPGGQPQIQPQGNQRIETRPRVRVINSKPTQ